MKKLLVCFAICSCFLSSFLVADEPDKKLHEKCIYPTVKLKIPLQFGGGCGSGVIVRSSKREDGKFNNVVLTAAHNLDKAPVSVCVPKFKDWSAVTGYDEYECVVFSASKKYDLAVIIFESPVVQPTAELDFSAKFFVGSQIFKLGFGVTDECRLDKGEITSVSTAEPPGFTDHLRMNANTIFGDSGGPMFQTSTYKVIGITKAIRSLNGPHGPQFLVNFAYASPLSWLKKWNTESQNELAFVWDDTVPVLSVEQIKKRNTLLNLKAQLDKVKKDILAKAAEIEEHKRFETTLNSEIQRIVEGRPLPVPVDPDTLPDSVPEDEPAVAPPPPIE